MSAFNPSADDGCLIERFAFARNSTPQSLCLALPKLRTCLHRSCCVNKQLEFSVRILPLGARWNWFYGVPVLGDFPVLNSVQVVIGHRAISEAPLGHNKYEIAFPQHLVNAIVLHGLPLASQRFQSREQARQVIRDERVVLDVVVALEVARKFVLTTMEKVIHVGLHQHLVGLGLVEIRYCRRPINHRVATWTGLESGFLQIVPMFDNFPVFEAKDIETDLRAEEVVVGMENYEIAILKHTHRIDLSCSPWKRLQ